MPIRLTPTVKFLLISCGVIFLVQQTIDQFLGGNLLSWFGLVPAGVVLQYRFWQLFTYAFVHSDVAHLFFNLLVLVMIGGELESVWGKRRFLSFYFFCSVSAGIFYLFLQLFLWRDTGIYVPMVGSSGAIYGLLMAYGLLFGERILLFMLLFPMKAKHFIWILAAFLFLSTVYSGRGGLANAAHLAGMLAGFIYLWGRAAWVVFQRQRKQKTVGLTHRDRGFKRQKTAQHLKLVINNEKNEIKKENSDVNDNPKTWH